MIRYWLFVISYWLLVIRGLVFTNEEECEDLELKQQMEVAEKIMREDYNLLKRLAE